MRQLFGGDLPRLVMFDLDGTLVDSVPDLALAVDRMLLALGRPEAGVDQVRQWVGNGAAVLVQRALSGSCKVDEAAIRHEFDKALDLFLAFYAEVTAKSSQVYEGVVHCLQQLQQQQVTLALVTNKPMRFTDVMLRELELADYFALVLGGDSLAEKKPHPQMLLHSMEATGSRPEQSLMVGDSRNDVLAARAAGCPVACVSYGYNHGEPISASQPDLLVDSLRQLL